MEAVMRVDTARVKELRRRVLQALAAAAGPGYDGWLSVASLFSILRPDSDGLTLGELARAVKYLAEKGYTETRERREKKWDRPEVDARITADGTDLLEETIPADPGVEDERE
jgi:DNA-binding transcriptional ArsR family regulator